MPDVVNLEDLPTEVVSHGDGIPKKTLIRNGVVPHLTNYARSRLQPGQVAKEHVHKDMHEVFFCVAGAGEISVDGVAIELRPGTCVTVKPLERHEVRNTHPSEELVLQYFGIA
eukprot:tig00001214_g7546.t1